MTRRKERIFVTNSGAEPSSNSTVSSNTVSVISDATNTVVSTVTVGKDRRFGL